MFGVKIFFLKMKNVFRFITKTSKDGFLENVLISNKSFSKFKNTAFTRKVLQPLLKYLKLLLKPKNQENKYLENRKVNLRPKIRKVLCNTERC